MMYLACVTRLNQYLFIPVLCTLLLQGCDENINEPVVEDQVFEVIENAPAGTIVGVVTAYDPDGDQTLSYRISGGNEDSTFVIDRGSGHVTVHDPAMLDYEQNTSMAFQVTVSDDGDPVLETMVTITIEIKDVNEFAPVVEDQSFQAEAGIGQGTLIGTIAASDPESHQGLLFILVSGNEEDMVSLDTSSGELTVNDPQAFAVQAEISYMFTVQVRDLHIDSKSDMAVITVTVIP